MQCTFYEITLHKFQPFCIKIDVSLLKKFIWERERENEKESKSTPVCCLFHPNACDGWSCARAAAGAANMILVSRVRGRVCISGSWALWYGMQASNSLDWLPVFSVGTVYLQCCRGCNPSHSHSYQFVGLASFEITSIWRELERK